MVASVVAAAVPAVMVAVNLRRYQPLGLPVSRNLGKVSVLIPARNEEGNIRPALESILQCEGLEFEVIVWDDESSDGTAAVVNSVASQDLRVRLVAGVPPPPGWAGKPHACWNLAQQASGEVLLFLDADVRLRGRDALAKMSGAFVRSGLDLLSGVPLQRVETLSEVMVVPLIHFILLGFLPIAQMRASCDPRFAAACGQLMLARRSVYLEVGGHSRTRGSFHEGIALARVFRAAGKVTDLFDATGVAVCRMYEGFRPLWNGFSKNAHEGIASPRAILPFSAFLILGQVLPFAWLLGGGMDGTSARLAFLALSLSLLSRWMITQRFKQPLSGVLLQPLGVGLLLLIQWYGALRHWIGKPVGWRGRIPCIIFAFLLLLSEPGLSESKRCPDLVLADQNNEKHEVRFPRSRPLYLVAARRAGTGNVADWVRPVAKDYGERVDIFGIADVSGIPSMFRGAVRMSVREGTGWPVLMDWRGETVGQLCTSKSLTEVFVVRPDGQIALCLSGASSEESLKKVRAEMDRMLLHERGKFSPR